MMGLHAAQTDVDQLADRTYSPGRLPVMRQDRQPTGPADRADRPDRPESGPRHECRGASVEPADECVLDADRVPGRDEGTGSGRSPEGLIRGVVGDEVVVDRHPQLTESLDDSLETHPALLALRRQRRLERLVVEVDAETDDVHLLL